MNPIHYCCWVYVCVYMDLKYCSVQNKKNHSNKWKNEAKCSSPLVAANGNGNSGRLSLGKWLANEYNGILLWCKKMNIEIERNMERLICTGAEWSKWSKQDQKNTTHKEYNIIRKKKMKLNTMGGLSCLNLALEKR